MNFIEWLKQSWLVLTVIAGALSLLLGLKKSVKAISDDIHKPMKDVTDKLTSIEKTMKDTSEKLTSMETQITSNTQQLGVIDRTLKIQNDALLGLEKAAVINSCEQYIKQGYADVNHRNALDKQYTSYVALGDGSHFVEDLMSTVKNLPLEKPKAKKQQLNG